MFKGISIRLIPSSLLALSLGAAMPAQYQGYTGAVTQREQNASGEWEIIRYPNAEWIELALTEAERPPRNEALAHHARAILLFRGLYGPDEPDEPDWPEDLREMRRQGWNEHHAAVREWLLWQEPSLREFLSACRADRVRFPECDCREIMPDHSALIFIVEMLSWDCERMAYDRGVYAGASQALLVLEYLADCMEEGLRSCSPPVFWQRMMMRPAESLARILAKGGLSQEEMDALRRRVRILRSRDLHVPPFGAWRGIELAREWVDWAVATYVSEDGEVVTPVQDERMARLAEQADFNLDHVDAAYRLLLASPERWARNLADLQARIDARYEREPWETHLETREDFLELTGDPAILHTLWGQGRWGSLGLPEGVLSVQTQLALCDALLQLETDHWGPADPVRDPFTGEPVGISNNMVWSVGPDRIDQGGAEGSDDIVVRRPPRD